MRFSVAGMKCEGCEQVLEEVLSKQPGIIRVEADYAASELSVAFEGGVITPERIKRVAGALGYRLAIDHRRLEAVIRNSKCRA